MVEAIVAAILWLFDPTGLILIRCLWIAANLLA